MSETHKRKQLNSDELAALVVMILSDLKAESVKSLNVGHLTTGLRVLMGLGAIAAAFFALILRRRSFLAG